MCAARLCCTQSSMHSSSRRISCMHTDPPQAKALKLTAGQHTCQTCPSSEDSTQPTTWQCQRTYMHMHDFKHSLHHAGASQISTHPPTRQRCATQAVQDGCELKPSLLLRSLHGRPSLMCVQHTAGLACRQLASTTFQANLADGMQKPPGPTLLLVFESPQHITG